MAAEFRSPFPIPFSLSFLFSLSDFNFCQLLLPIAPFELGRPEIGSALPAHSPLAKLPLPDPREPPIREGGGR
jgi:hypothetical protein